MKHVRSAALARLDAPDFSVVSRFETTQLRKAKWLARVLFHELVCLINFDTGRGRASWARLLALVDFDQGMGPRAPKATVKCLRTAFAELVELGLVKVDAKRNKRAKALFFRLPSRDGIFASEARLGRRLGRPPTEVKPPETGQSTGQGVQENSSPPTPSPVDNRRPSRTVLAMRSRVKAPHAAGALNGAPQGARNGAR